MRGDDFSIFEVTTDASFDVVSLGDEKVLHLGDKVYNISLDLSAWANNILKATFQAHRSIVRS